MQNLDNHLFSSIKAALIAGQKSIEIYNRNYQVSYKNDKSPVTVADIEANKIIQDNLKKYGIPILSEESDIIPYNYRKNWEYYWLIDPIDGTKEFINKTGEYTVNIALIKHNQPILGVVYSPMTSELYFGSSIEHSKKIHADLSKKKNLNIGKLISNGISLPIKKKDKCIVLVSKSHLNLKTLNYINILKLNNPNLEIIKMGSSLKLCKIAEGEADIYPRFGPTKEWDTAAGHAVLKFSGGNILDENGDELVYNKPKINNSNFIAST